jgi:hypothetical protein
MESAHWRERSLDTVCEQVAHGICIQRLCDSPGFFDMLTEALETRRIRGEELSAVGSFGVSLSFLATTQRGTDAGRAEKLAALHRLAEGLVAAAGTHPPALGIAMRLRALTSGRRDMADLAEAAAVAGPGVHPRDSPVSTIGMITERT